jgi:hypothetical protein
MHDFEAHLPDGLVAALEVTGVVERQRLNLAASADRRLSGLRLRGSRHVWQVRLAADAIVNSISPEILLGLLKDMEDHGLQRALNMGDDRDQFVARLQASGSSSCKPSRPNPGARASCMSVPDPTAAGDGAPSHRCLAS